MKIKMLTTAAGPTGTYMAGSVYDVPDEQARAYLAGGYAKLVSVIVEAATAPVVKEEERAVAPEAPEERVFTRKRTNL